MLPARRRLRSSEVADIMRRGAPRRGCFTTARVSPSGDATLRVAAVVPKSLAGNAVVRNRVRRALYRAAAALPHEKGASIVVFVRTIPPPPLAPAFLDDLKHIVGPGR